MTQSPALTQGLIDFLMAYMQTMLVSFGTMLSPAFSIGLMEELSYLPQTLTNSFGGIPGVLDTFGSGYLVGR